MPTQTLVENSSPRFCVFRNNDKVRRLGYQLEQYLWNVRETFGFTADWPVGLCGAARALRQADVLVDFCWLQVIFGYFSMMFSKKNLHFSWPSMILPQRYLGVDFSDWANRSRSWKAHILSHLANEAHPSSRWNCDDIFFFGKVFPVFPVFLFSSCTFRRDDLPDEFVGCASSCVRQPKFLRIDWIQGFGIRSA